MLFDETLPAGGEVARGVLEYRARLEDLVLAALLAQIPRGRGGRRARAEVAALSAALLGAAEALGRWWLRTGAIPADEAAELLDRHRRTRPARARRRPDHRERNPREAHEHDPSPGRGRRREPDPLRPLQRRVRPRVQPGHADRRRSTASSTAPRCTASASARSSAARCSSTRATATSRASRSSARALAPETPAYDVQQACGTGLEAVVLVANKIALGQIDAGIACGVDTASDAPISLNDDLRGILLDLNRASRCRRAR